MDYPTRLDFCDGKYTVIYDFSTGQSECLRYGQPWRQLVGDKMVLAMFDRVVELQAEVAALKAELAAAILAEAVPQCTHKYEIDSDHPNHSCCQNCGEILKDGVHVQPVAQARSRAGMLAAAEMERSKGK